MYATRESSLVRRPLQGAFLIPPVLPVVLIVRLRWSRMHCGNSDQTDSSPGSFKVFMLDNDKVARSSNAEDP